ncbi:FAD:protein FMN transferase [bacterium]|nr:FAD:protein FMN transferase [bacterium]
MREHRESSSPSPAPGEAPAAAALTGERGDGVWILRFAAMAGPCEIQLALADGEEATALGRAAAAEAWRIEAKYSRYRADSAVSRINAAGGAPIAVDAETAGLLDLAARCHELSGGLFDVTAGVLRRVWRFDGEGRLPPRAQVKALLPLVGWEKLRWEPPTLTLPAGMEIDLGGLGKEYAVDRCLALIGACTAAPCLVNFGGDLRVSGPRAGERPWRVALEDPARPETPLLRLDLRRGALATSGDSRRFLLHRGRRYAHVLNPHTGWPVSGAPRSVSVAAPSCLEAGLHATLALLHGRRAAAYLAAQGHRHWIVA